ncbi:hypothetical protein [Paraburkholderia sp. A3RO-2L]|uniref:hypothetical protein n=1 Tax=unclassified Paraburkholderia TaxID=2615204 RepID=UPI003DA7B144
MESSFKSADYENTSYSRLPRKNNAARRWQGIGRRATKKPRLPRDGAAFSLCGPQGPSPERQKAIYYF